VGTKTVRLSNLKILSKILLVIGLLSAVAAVLTYNAVTAMSDMDKASYKMDAQATNSRLIARERSRK
jgi:methyl-accepting chemotaxis protein